MNKVVKAIRTPYYRALGYYPTTIQGLTFKCDPYHIAFWRSVSKCRWEPHTYGILSRFLHHDSVYCDIGAWIGPTVIYAAKKCKQVICFEPDFFAYRYLLWNIQLNKLHNVMPFNVALTDRNAIIKMASFGHKLGDSTTSLLDTGREEGAIHVLTMTWKTWADICKPEVVDFMKIDIEGGEFSLLPMLKDYLASNKPIIYLSTHTPLISRSDRREQMQRVIQVMKIYKTCLNEELERVDINELNSNDTIDHFRSFLFMD